jgi:hypothetical protein
VVLANQRLHLSHRESETKQIDRLRTRESSRSIARLGHYLYAYKMHAKRVLYA